MVFFASVTEYYTIEQFIELKPWRYLLDKDALFPNCLHPLVNSMPGDEPVMDWNHIQVKVENSLWTINAAETKISSLRRWNPAFKLGPKKTSQDQVFYFHLHRRASELWSYEGRTGVVSSTVHEPIREPPVHRYKNFFFPNHENKKIRCSFNDLFLH